MTITVYTLPNCPACRLVKNMLVKEDISFHSVDLLTAPDQAAILREAGYMSAPIIQITNNDRVERIGGFKIDLIRNLINEITSEE